MKKIKLDIQNIFILVSAVFLITCCAFYGTRFVKLYLENEEKIVIESNTLGKDLLEKNHDKLKNINDEYYFYGDIDSNYVRYSGILWRVIKISDNNVVTMISDNTLTSISYGENKSYQESYVNNWLNKNDTEYSGILEKNLSSMVTYLKHSDLCNDKIDDISNSKCNNINNDYFITSLSINDYINTGAGNGFINTSEYFYLSDTTSDNLVWYVNSDGKIDKNNGIDTYGVKAVIKTKENLNLVGGDGTLDNPYIIENSHSIFGSYIKLAEDIWRVIDVTEDKLKLMRNDYVKNGENNFSYKYSIYNSNYDINKKNTLAYYLNRDYYNSLSYKDLILDSNYSNGYYGLENGYNYVDTLTHTVNAKIALIGIGDIILNHELDDYFTSISSSTKNNFVYTIQNDGIPYSKIINTSLPIVPVITISKQEFEGTGTLNDPLRLVNNNE